VTGRVFNGRAIELLAPAGTFDTFWRLLGTGCDAVYLGGRRLNMRMIRPGYNLSDEELAAAVDLARSSGKKLYVTVNSLLSTGELAEAEAYLGFLAQLGPDGLIVQDAAVLELAGRVPGLPPLHASVMMNAHNRDGLEFLARRGVTRAVLSREMPLEAVRALAADSPVELEYFVHGDMCVANGSLCYYSSWLFGQSSNRGRCLKPCRWPYALPDWTAAAGAAATEDAPAAAGAAAGGPEPFPLAVKDLNLYGHLGALLAAGVSAFKIEGRMRQPEYIVGLVEAYGRALDRALDDPSASGADPAEIEEYRKRDWSTGYAFGTPGPANINRRGEGTGQFYSTGKMFSVPTAEREIAPPPPGAAPPGAAPTTASAEAGARLNLAVRADTVAQADLALAFRPERIYLSLEPLAPAAVPSLAEIAALRARAAAAGAQLWAALPRMLSDAESGSMRAWLDRRPALDGLLVGYAGAFTLAAGRRFRLAGDLWLNLTNPAAIALYRSAGMDGWTASPELPFDELAALPAATRAWSGAADGEAEVLVHGRPAVMYLDHDVSGRAADRTVLATPAGELESRRDARNRYQLLPAKELSLLPRLPELAAAGYSRFRLDLTGYAEGEARARLAAVRAALDAPDGAASAFAGLEPAYGGFTYGAHQF
jgi:putative protease